MAARLKLMKYSEMDIADFGARFRNSKTLVLNSSFFNLKSVKFS